MDVCLCDCVLVRLHVGAIVSVLTGDDEAVYPRGCVLMRFCVNAAVVGVAVNLCDCVPMRLCVDVAVDLC